MSDASRVATAGRAGPWLQAARFAVPIAACAGLAVFFVSGLHRHMTIHALQLHGAELRAIRADHPVTFAALYVGTYIVVASAAVPASLLLTVAGGYCFGLAEGILLATLATSIAAVLTFSAGRFLLRDWVRRRFASRVAQLDRGVEDNGVVTLASLRLVPVIPFFLVNLLSGVAGLSMRRFWAVTVVAMLPETAVFANAGTELGRLTSLSAILSRPVLASFVLMALLPIGASLAIRWLRRIA